MTLEYRVERVKQLEKHRRILAGTLVLTILFSLSAWYLSSTDLFSQKGLANPVPSCHDPACPPFQTRFSVTWNVNNSLYLKYWNWRNLTRSLTVSSSGVQLEILRGWSCTPFPLPTGEGDSDIPLGCGTVTNRVYYVPFVLQFRLTMTNGAATVYDKSFLIGSPLPGSDEAPCAGVVTQTKQTPYVGIISQVQVPELCLGW